MSVGMAFSFKNSGQKGKITRVMCCTDEEKASYPQDMLTIMDTHVAPSFAFDKKTNDHYAAFNKPGYVLAFAVLTASHRSTNNAPITAVAGMSDPVLSTTNRRSGACCTTP